jgi:hypothetical protein
MIDDDPIDRLLRALYGPCGGLLGGAITALAVVWVVLVRAGDLPVAGGPLPPSFLLMIVAMVVVLLSSAARGAVLRKAVEAEEDGRLEAEEEGHPPRAKEIAPLLGAYRRATLLCFGLLALASALGAGMALVGASPQYGLVVCAISPIVMAARWPRRAAVELLLEGSWGR